MLVDWTKFEGKIRERYADSSANAYAIGAREFMAWIGHDRELEPGDLQAWVDQLVGEGRSAITIQTYLRGTNLLLDWLRSEGYTLPPLEPVRLPRVWRRALVPAPLAEQYRAKVALSEPYRTCVLLAPELELHVTDWAHWRAAQLVVDRDARAWVLTDATGLRVATLGRWATATLTHYVQHVRPMLDGYSPSSPWLFPHPRGNKPIEGEVAYREARRIIRELKAFQKGGSNRKRAPVQLVERKKDTA